MLSAPLVGLPKLLQHPLGTDSLGDIMLFAPSESIDPRVDQRIQPVDVDTHYPSLLIWRNGKIYAIPRDDIHAAGAFPVYQMQLQQILYEPGRDTWIGYDASTGNLLRLRLSVKRNGV